MALLAVISPENWNSERCDLTWSEKITITNSQSRMASSSLPKIEKKLLLLIFILHVVGFYLLNLSWHADIRVQQMQTVMKPMPQAKPMRTFVLSSDQLNAMMPKPSTTQIASITDKALQKKKFIGAKPKVKLPSPLQSKTMTKSAITKKLIQKSLKRPNITINNSSTTIAKATTAQTTQSYLQKLQAKQFNDMLQQQADSYLQQKLQLGTLSEITPNPTALDLVAPKPISEYRNLDSELDPNRIIKHGNTCYRIVDVSNALNPYAENLGYEFKCGQSDTEKALEAALSKRISFNQQQ